MRYPRSFRVLILCTVSAVAVACGSIGSGGGSDAQPGRATTSGPSGFAEPTSSSPSGGSPSDAAPNGDPSSSGSGPGGHPSGGSPSGGSSAEASPSGNSSAGSSSADESATANASPANPPGSTLPANPPPVEDTDEPLPSTSTSSQPRTVEVSGPTIDNRYPAEGLRFSAGETKICNPFVTSGSSDLDVDPAGVPVTIRAVEIVNQIPSGTPVFTVIPVQDLSTCLLGERLRSVGNCEGATLPPFSGGRTSACLLGLEFTGTTEYTATVRFQAEAICADTKASPCDAEEVRTLTPTPAAPVTVRWSTVVGTVTG